MYTGLVTDSYEACKQKEEETDGVLSNRKLQVMLEISKDGGNFLEHEIIQIGWRLDDEFGLGNSVNPRIPGGAEYASHSCNPNCRFVTLEDYMESYDIEIDGTIYVVRYYPIFLEVVRDIPRGELAAPGQVGVVGIEYAPAPGGQVVEQGLFFG